LSVAVSVSVYFFQLKIFLFKIFLKNSNLSIWCRT